MFPENNPRTCFCCNGTGNKFYYFKFAPQWYFKCHWCDGKGYTTKSEYVNCVKNKELIK